MAQKRSILSQFLITLVCILLMAAGCTTANDETPPPSQNQPQDQTPAPTEPDEKPEPDKTVDTDVTEELKQEKDVSGGNVYEKNGVIMGSILLKDSEDAAYAKQLADKYLEKLKVKYPGKRINVQVVGNGKNLANVDYKP